MTNDNRVLWSEGLFLQPHHFQQHDRWVEHLVTTQAGIGTCYPWGLKRLVIDRDLLDLGKLSITECSGILPDGTPFDAPKVIRFRGRWTWMIMMRAKSSTWACPCNAPMQH